MTDLTTDYLGLQLRSPLVASASPLTGDVDQVRIMCDSGVAAVVLPSLFQEQIEHDTFEIDRLYSLHHESFGEATSFVPEIDSYNTGSDAYLMRVEAVRDVADVPVIASLNGSNPGGWLRYGRLLEEAGADAIELNLYTVAADPTRTSHDVERDQLDVIRGVVDAVGVPVSVKISPFYSSLASFALDVERTGAAGMVLFNRFYAPDLDLDTLDLEAAISLSDSSELGLPLRWIGILRELVHVSLAASSGVHTGHDVAKLLLAGSDVTMMTSALLLHGPAHIGQVEHDLVAWMRERDYESVRQMRGAVSRDATSDPAAYERANYIGNLTTYSSRFMGTQPIGLQGR